MKLEIDIPEHQYNNIIALNSLSLGRVPYKGIIMYAINAIKNATPVDQEPNVRHCFGCKYSKDNHNAGTEECHLCMWENQYTPTTKNDLGVDCISRAEAIKCLECDFDITGKENMKTVVNYINSAHDKIVNLPRVKQEPFEPMVEIDLYSVIKQIYIEREVLDKIRAEIDEVYEKIDGYDPDSLGTFACRIDDIIDKYKAETEEI